MLEDVKKAIASRDYTGEASRLIESLFLLSAESLKDVQTSAMLSDKERVLDNLEFNRQMLKKRKRLCQDGDIEMIMK